RRGGVLAEPVVGRLRRFRVVGGGAVGGGRLGRGRRRDELLLREGQPVGECHGLNRHRGQGNRGLVTPLPLARAASAAFGRLLLLFRVRRAGTAQTPVDAEGDKDHDQDAEDETLRTVDRKSTRLN